MGRYKRFLFTHEEMPKSTYYWRRRKEREMQEKLTLLREQERLRLQHEQEAVNTTNHTQMGVSESETISSQSAPQRDSTHSQEHESETISSQSAPQYDSTYSQELATPEDVVESEAISEQHQQDDVLETEAENVLRQSSQSGDCESDEETVDNTATFPDTARDDPDVGKLPLCSHTDCTEDDVVLMCLALGLRHGLTWEAQVDILKMINALYGENKIQATKYSYLKQLLGNEKVQISYHVYCSDCSHYIGKREVLKGCVLCSNCGQDVVISNKGNYFISLSLESQLKTLLENREIAEMVLTHRFNRSKENSDSLEDIFDGSEYRRHCAEGGMLASPHNFSYSFSTDGVPLGKSQKKTLWPIYVTINELPPKERNKHVMLCGLYVGPEDPNHTVFMKPFVDQANHLSTTGLSWTYNGNEINSKVIPLVAVTDSVARYQLMNRQSFMAYYGCTFCYQKSTRTTRRLKFTLPFQPVEERTIDSNNQDLQEAFDRRGEALEKNRHCRGVKGPSPLSRLFYFSLITGFVVDYMHNILLGVAKSHFSLISESVRRKFWISLSEERYAMEDILSEIDSRLQTVKPPSSITRTPRSIKDCSNWKASEWRSWLLFYCIPCLTGLLKKKHLVHLAMLSKATNLLLQKSITYEEVGMAHKLFQHYSFLFQNYFGEEHMYYNIHLLSHVCKGVLRWGPLWTHNAFVYEGQNRHLLQLCKNPFSVVMEISKKYLVFKSLPQLCSKLASNDHTILFCEETLEQKLIRFVRSGQCVLLGKGELYCFSVAEERCLLRSGIKGCECVVFNRMLFNGMRISTFEYSKRKKNNDSFVHLRDGNQCVVRNILLTPTHSTLLLVENISFHEESVLADECIEITHLKTLKTFGSVYCTEVTSIQGQCVFVDTVQGQYLSKMPLGCYGD